MPNVFDFTSSNYRASSGMGQVPCFPNEQSEVHRGAGSCVVDGVEDWHLMFLDSESRFLVFLHQQLNMKSFSHRRRSRFGTQAKLNSGLVAGGLLQTGFSSSCLAFTPHIPPPT